jgi:hypothetical protein
MKEGSYVKPEWSLVPKTKMRQVCRSHIDWWQTMSRNEGKKARPPWLPVDDGVSGVRQ